MYSQKEYHTSPSLVSYEGSFVSILYKNDLYFYDLTQDRSKSSIWPCHNNDKYNNIKRWSELPN